jgi:hypothetical protein
MLSLKTDHLSRIWKREVATDPNIAHCSSFKSSKLLNIIVYGLTTSYRAARAADNNCLLHPLVNESQSR